jgi:hypothetical protein
MYSFLTSETEKENTVIHGPAFKRLPNVIRNIIWDYIGCVCDINIIVRVNAPIRIMTYNYYGYCGYQYNHYCNDSVYCRGDEKTVHTNICKSTKPHSTVLLMYSIRHKDDDTLFFRGMLNKSKHRFFIEELIEKRNKSHNSDNTIHDYEISYNGDKF